MNRNRSERKVQASFIAPMLLLRVESLPEGDGWEYELKLDGYRALGIKTGGKVELRSRNDNDFSLRYAAITKALAGLPNETVIDGEVVALDSAGRPSFNTLQNFSSSHTSELLFYAFDVPILAGRDVQSESLDIRRELLRTRVLSSLDEPVRYSPTLEAKLPSLIRSAREQGFEGLVAKQRSSLYEAGKRTGAWQKMRINRGQEFVIGGYTLSAKNFDALVLGYYESDQLIYLARTRNGFTPSLRDELFKLFRSLRIEKCPFANLPEPRSGRRGVGLTAEKMKECRWLKPVLVGQFEFVEWTPDDHLRHSRFIGLREDKKATEVRQE